MALTRREFVRYSGTALSASALMSRLGLMSAMAQGGSGYKALVIIFLNGGSDAFNMIVPYDQNTYNYYQSKRPVIARTRPTDPTVVISPPSQASNPISTQFFFHQSMPEILNLWKNNKVAVLTNIGTLIAPITPAQYRSTPSLRPISLFDHNAQQTEWQNLRGDSQGWGQGLGIPVESLNTNPRVPMFINVTGGASVYLAGTEPYITLAPGQGLNIQGFNSSAASTARYNALRQLLMLGTDSALVRVISDNTSKAIDDGQLVSSTLGSATLTTTFPNTSLGSQLLQIAKIIKIRATLGHNSRQVFFAQIGGFDTHQGENAAQPSLLMQVSQGMNAFYNATQELGVGPNVTTVTLSDFGRTFQTTIDGTDHGWGSNALVMGDAVNGGDFYGTYPDITLAGANDADTGTGARGRFVPTTAVDQYAATLGTWFGVGSGDLQTAIPNLSRFSPTNLGFMMP